MSRRANRYDNAPMESANGTLKVERVHDQHYATLREVIGELTKYIAYCYTERRHSALGYVSPAEFEGRWAQRQDASGRSAASYPPARASRAYEAPHPRARG